MATIPTPSHPASTPPPIAPIAPSQTYHSTIPSPQPPLRLLIATGGAGQSGLLHALATAFIDSHVHHTHCPPFAIAWLRSDTASSFNHLARGSADVSITYHPFAESIAVAQGVVERSVYAWRDHFLLVGPASNPADLSLDRTASIQTLFAQLFRAAVADPSAVRFLSRYDRSATNIKESVIWASVGQCPWVDAEWYHRFPAFPYEALGEAARGGMYTLVDRGTWWGVEGGVRGGMRVFLEGQDSDPDPILLNPAHALVGTWGKNKEMAHAFADWMVREDGGQKVVGGFMGGGVVLYTRALESGELEG